MATKNRIRRDKGEIAAARAARRRARRLDELRRAQEDVALEQDIRARQRNLDLSARRIVDGIRASWQQNESPRGRLGHLIQTSRLSKAHMEPACRIIRAAERSRLIEDRFLIGLLEFAKRSDEWIRPPESWSERSHNARRQFRSLARHLFSRFDVPGFLDHAWLNGERAHQDWFIAIGHGISLYREPTLPIPLSRRMLHHFLAAPSIGVPEALRWGQARALGASRHMADAIVATRLGRDVIPEQNDFWLSVMRFFIAHPDLGARHYEPIIDYLNYIRHVSAGRVMQQGQVVELPPQQANLSMSGRTPETLLRQVRKWHDELGFDRSGLLTWESCGIPSSTLTEGQGKERRYHFRELCDSVALREEGRAMRHCVGSYAHLCARGECAIYSLSREEDGQIVRCMTIEIDRASFRIVQARRKANMWPRASDLRVLRTWAMRHRLDITCQLGDC